METGLAAASVAMEGRLLNARTPMSGLAAVSLPKGVTRTDPGNKIVFVGKVFDAREGRFPVTRERSGEVIGGRGKRVYFDF